MAARWGVRRRDFFRLSLWGLGLALLLACNLPLQPPKPALTLTPAELNLPLAPFPTLTPVPTRQPTATPLVCARLLTPENGARLKGGGKVTFSWEPMPDAAVYWLQVTLPSGQTLTFDARGATSRDQYLEAFELNGVYYWQVSVVGRSGALLCTSAPFTFDKGQ